MTKYLFDTGFLVPAILNELPEKWYRPWKEVRSGIKTGYTIEPVIAEVYYQLLKRGFTKDNARNIIFQKIKTTLAIIDIDNNISISAGYYYMRFRDLKLSYTDCFLLVTAKRDRMKLYTTDSKIKRASKELGVLCEYLPITD